MKKVLTKEMTNAIETIAQKLIEHEGNYNELYLKESGKYDIAIRFSTVLPPYLAHLLKVNDLTEELFFPICPCLTKVYLDKTWQQRGFFSQLVSRLLEIDTVHFVVVALVNNPKFNRALRLSQSWQLLLDNHVLLKLKDEGYLIQNESLTLKKLDFQLGEAFKYGLSHSEELEAILSNLSSNRLKASCSREVISKGLFSGITPKPRTADNIFKHFYISK